MNEYSYTRNAEDSLTALGYAAQDISGDPRLKHGLEKAKRQIVKGDIFE